MAATSARDAPGLVALAKAARDPAATPTLRIVAAALEAGGGILARVPVRASLEALGPDERKRLRRIGVTIGAIDLFDPRLLKPRAARWRQALLAAANILVELPPDGATVLVRGVPGAVLVTGFRPIGHQAVRIDLVERLARATHDARQGRTPFALDPALATSMGLEPATIERLMAELGFRSRHTDAGDRWVWQGRRPPRVVPVARPVSTNAFAALAGLVGHG